METMERKVAEQKRTDSFFKGKKVCEQQTEIFLLLANMSVFVTSKLTT